MAAVEAVHPGQQHLLLGVLSSMFRQAPDEPPVLHSVQSRMCAHPMDEQFKLFWVPAASSELSASRLCRADMMLYC